MLHNGQLEQSDRECFFHPSTNVSEFEALSRCAIPSTTQGKIERWHQTLKNRILLENYFLPSDLEAFVDHYNHRRYHESLNNVTPADVCFGRDKAVIKQRDRIKRKTLEARCLHHRQRAT